MIRLTGGIATDVDTELYAGEEEGGLFDPDSATFATGLLMMIGVLVAIHLGVGRHSV